MPSSKIKQADSTHRPITGGQIKGLKMFSRINIKSNAIFWPPCWHEHTYQPDRKQTSFIHWGMKQQVQIHRAFTTQGWRAKYTMCAFCFNPAPCSVLPLCFFQSGNAEADQTTENRVTSWPRAQTTETTASIKTGVLGHSIETPHELIMIQIILFAPDTNNPFWRLKSFYMLHTTNCSIFFSFLFQVKLSMWWENHSCQLHTAEVFIQRKYEWVLKIDSGKAFQMTT